MRRAVCILVLVLAGALLSQVRSQVGSKAAIVNSHHDFRATSTAAIRAQAGTDACVFCHTPHNANPGVYLWNHALPSKDFPSYSSSTMAATVTPVQPQDVSKLCLSCHDGTIALGETVSEGEIQFLQGAGYTLPADSSSNLAGAAGFSDDHPFGFAPVTGPEIQNPPPGDAVKLDGRGRIQCTTCHDPHQEFIDPTAGKFLVKSNAKSAMCTTCHVKAGWMQSAHRQPPDGTEDMSYTEAKGAHTGYLGVSNNGCESCHKPHTAGVAQRLLKSNETDLCYTCHDGSVDRKDMKSEFVAKFYRHPVTAAPSVHDASERPQSAKYPMPETASGQPRHVECADCHDSHYSGPDTPVQPPLAPGPVAGARGQTADNAFAPHAVNEYEVCFKCHGDSANKPQLNDASDAGIGYGRNPKRQYDAGSLNAFNTRYEFQIMTSYHPVTRPRNLSLAEVPSLRATAPVSPGGTPLTGRAPLSPTSYIYCSDCHNSDSGRNLGSGTLPEGPHGSNIPHILERQNALEAPALNGGSSAGVAYSATSYGLCDKCHDVQGSVLRDVSFKLHNDHVVTQHAACATCHDPHASESPMLINFDKAVVAPSSAGQLQYTRTGPGHGTCSLTCHGKDHNPLGY